MCSLYIHNSFDYKQDEEDVRKDRKGRPLTLRDKNNINSNKEKVCGWLLLHALKRST